ncbi:MAG: hypothetical protein RBU30_12150 [Polyangia bacterium]|nr:hypothetical protein [Polyangia bacterium]
MPSQRQILGEPMAASWNRPKGALGRAARWSVVAGPPWHIEEKSCA